MTHTLFKSTRTIFLRIRGAFIRNPGAAFIIGFQTLLFTCAGLLIQGKTALANDVAVNAYCLLIVGIILQAISLMKVKGAKEEEHDER